MQARRASFSLMLRARKLRAALRVGTEADGWLAAGDFLVEGGNVVFCRKQALRVG